MKTKIKHLPQSQVEIEFEVAAQDFTGFFEQAILKLGQNMERPGFRKGKVPREVVVREASQDAMLAEAAKLAIESSYKKAVRDFKLEPLSQPQITIIKLPALSRTQAGVGVAKDPFCFKGSFFVLPEIKLPDCRLIASKVKREKISIKTLEVENVLIWLQKSRPRFKELAKVAREGDFVEIEFSSLQIEGGKIQRDAFLLGKGHLISGIEEKIAGMKKGQKKSFSVAVPKNHFQKEITGKEIEVELKMNAVKEVKFPEINDELAQSLGKFADLTALKRSIKQGLGLEKEAAETERVRIEILEKIDKECRFETPSVLVEAEKQRMLMALKQRVGRNLNLSWQEYLEQIHPVKSDKVGAKQFNGVQKSEQELLGSWELEAQKRVRNFLILREIAKAEGVEVSKEEVKEEINKILALGPSAILAFKDIDPVRDSGDKKGAQSQRISNGVDLENLKDYTEERIKTEKTLARLESFMPK